MQRRRADASRRARELILLLALGIAPAADSHRDHTTDPAAVSGPTRAPGYGKLGFEAPSAGTYSLPSLGPAADGSVIDTDGRPHRLHDMMAGKLVLLSFVYASCSDINGCPLATYVLGRVQEVITASPALRDRVRLLTLSFDPVRDTPAAMKVYGRHFRQPGFDWHFLTTGGAGDLGALLESYGQWVAPEQDARGRVLGTFSHLLRVYLVDDQRRIRNIYNANFLHPEILVNDLLTALGTEDRGRADPAAK